MPTYKEIMDLALDHEDLCCDFPTEKSAYDFRYRCYAWRKRQQKQGITTYDTIVIRKSRGSTQLIFQTGSTEIVITTPDGKKLEPKVEDTELLDAALALQKEISE